MKITTNLKTGSHGAGLCEGDILEIRTDEECVFIASEVMTEYRFLMHQFRGAPVNISQEDYTEVDHIRLQRYGMSLADHKVLVKAVCYGIDNAQDELDTEIYIYPKGVALTDPNAPPVPPSTTGTAVASTVSRDFASQTLVG